MDLASSLLLSTLVALTGVLISMRAATAQDAAQSLMVAFLMPSTILGFVFVVTGARDMMAGLNGDQVLAGILVLMLFVVWGVGLIVFKRFRRERLVLS